MDQASARVARPRLWRSGNRWIVMLVVKKYSQRRRGARLERPFKSSECSGVYLHEPGRYFGGIVPGWQRNAPTCVPMFAPTVMTVPSASCGVKVIVVFAAVFKSAVLL